MGFFLALVLHEKIDLERIALFSTSLNCASAVGVRLRGETATAASVAAMPVQLGSPSAKRAVPCDGT